MRRLFLSLLLFSAGAFAQPYPAKLVRVIVPFAPGGPTDVIARILGQGLGAQWGQQFVVENRPGAGGNVGVVAAARAPADGHTLLVTSSAIAVNMTLSAEPGYDVHRDFIAVANVASSPNMIVTAPSGPASLAQLIGKPDPRGLAYGSPGTGTTPHLSAEYLFKILAGLKVVHVPYKGAAPAVAAAMSGEVPVASVAMAAAFMQIKAGSLRGLAVTSDHRMAGLPDVPTVEESGFKGFADYTWIGVFLPAGTPAQVVEKLNRDVNALIARPEIRERLEGLAFEPGGGTPAQFAAYLRSEVAKWARVVRETGARSE